MTLIYEDWDKSYDLLSKWLRAVEEFNPDSWIKFISTPIDHSACAIFDHIFGPLHNRLKASNTVNS